MRCVDGLKLICFCIKNNFVFESKLAKAAMLIVRLTLDFIILVYEVWS